MDNKPTPPPSVHTNNDGLPDYYLGRLIYRDDDSPDNCRWVVYDGRSKVRCPTKRSAMDYICKTSLAHDDRATQLILSARLATARTISDLDRAASYETGAQRLLLERLAVRLRPVLVELDNILIPYAYDKKTTCQREA